MKHFFIICASSDDKVSHEQFYYLMSDKYSDYLKKRENNFNVKGNESFKLKEYNALHDPNMKHYFENNKIQYHLYNK